MLSSDFPWCRSGCRQSWGRCSSEGLGESAAVWMPSWYSVTQSGNARHCLLSCDNTVKPVCELRRDCDKPLQWLVGCFSGWALAPSSGSVGAAGVRLGKEPALVSCLVKTQKEILGGWVFCKGPKACNMLARAGASEDVSYPGISRRNRKLEGGWTFLHYFDLKFWGSILPQAMSKQWPNSRGYSSTNMNYLNARILTPSTWLGPH